MQTIQVLYEMMLVSQRQQLHHTLAQTMEAAVLRTLRERWQRYRAKLREALAAAVAEGSIMFQPADGDAGSCFGGGSALPAFPTGTQAA
ncbi:MAG: hypothetical protein ACK4NM_19115, partial [Hydrogenophaga sp.]